VIQDQSQPRGKPAGTGLYLFGKPAGVVYVFQAGDELPAHTHEDADNHITVLTFGAIELSGDRAGEVHEAAPGKAVILDWKVGELHGFKALIDGTTAANIRRW